MTSDRSLDAQAAGPHATISYCDLPAQVKRQGRPRRRRYEKRPASAPPLFPLALSTRAIAVLVRRLPRSLRKGYEGDAVEFLMFGGRLSIETLLRVAARCSRSELLAERNVGRTTVDEIERWLARHDRSFRPDAESLEAALERAIGHLEAIIESRDEDAPLKAFLAIPALKRALRAAGGKSSC